MYMKLPKKENKSSYTIVLKDSTRNIVKNASSITGLNISEIIEYCIKFTNEKIDWNQGEKE